MTWNYTNMRGSLLRRGNYEQHNKERVEPKAPHTVQVDCSTLTTIHTQSTKHSRINYKLISNSTAAVAHACAARGFDRYRGREFSICNINGVCVLGKM